MKRSQAVHNLASMLDQSELPGEWKYHISLKVADDILRQLELTGTMVPPTIPDPDWQLYHPENHYINAWEPEDEEV